MTITEQAPPESQLRAGGEPAVLVAAGRVASELALRAERHDRDGTFSHENIEALWAGGLGNLTVPARLGGVDVALPTAARAIQLIAAGDASTALVLALHLISIRMLTEPESSAPDSLSRAVAASSLAGPALVNVLRVEPDLGTPARGGLPATRAEIGVDAEGADAWRLSGHKIYVTGSHGLQWLLVWAADGEGKVGFFLVPADAPGIEIRETWDHLGLRASASHDVLLHDVRVPLDHAFARVDPAAAPARGRSEETAVWQTVLLLSVYVGVARAARDWLIGYLQERTPTNLGAPLATLPRFQAAVGEIDALLHASEQLVAVHATAPLSSDWTSLAKVVVTRNLIDAVGLALALVGNPGLSYHHPLQRHYRDVLCSRVHTPQDDSVLAAAGRRALAA